MASAAQIFAAVNLFVNTYSDEDPERFDELREVFQRNKDSKLFKRIVDLQGRPTFRDFFRDMRRYPDDVNVLANADIFFTDTLNEAATRIRRLECYALTRWELKKDGSIEHYGHSDSQDAWIFLGAPNDMEETEFHQGVPDCDGRLAYVLKKNGWDVTNPSLSVQAVHLHLSMVRNYLLSRKGTGRNVPKKLRLGPPKAFVLISSFPEAAP